MATGDITIRTSFTPDITFSPFPSGEETTGLDTGKLFKPAIYVETDGGGRTVLYAPYGEPTSYFYLLLGALALFILLFLFRK